jgi:hypothetical protein
LSEGNLHDNVNVDWYSVRPARLEAPTLEGALGNVVDCPVDSFDNLQIGYRAVSANQTAEDNGAL